MMRLASQVALFVFVGGAVGGLVTVTLLFVWSFLFSGYFEPRYVAQFVMFLPVSTPIGIVLGSPAAIITGLVYAFGPPDYRRPIPISILGAITSLTTSLIAMVLMGWMTQVVFPLVTLLLFTVSGSAAAWVCHRIASNESF